MDIKSIRLNNFRQFIDTKIDFNYTNDQPISLIIGDNASGKTTLVDAIKWCFGGKKEFDDNNILNCKVKDKMQLGEKCSAEVEISFACKDRIYTLKRENTYKFIEDSKFISSQALNLSYIDESGTEYNIENQDIKQELESIFPSYMPELMFISESKYNFREALNNDIKFVIEFCKEYSLDGRKMLEENINKYFSIVCPERKVKFHIDNDHIQGLSLPAAEFILLVVILKISIHDILEFIKDNNYTEIEVFPLILDAIFNQLDIPRSEKMFTMIKSLSRQVIVLSNEYVINPTIKKALIGYINTYHKIDADYENKYEVLESNIINLGTQELKDTYKRLLENATAQF